MVLESMTYKLGLLLLAIASVSLFAIVVQNATASFIGSEAADIDVAEGENATSTGGGSNQTTSGNMTTGP